jgi:biopolymer transport protein ExbB
MHEAAMEKSGELSGRMFRKVEFLNIFGNLGPLMGLLGTVWGMIIAFGAMGAGGGEADAGGLARGISLALVNTMLGLGLAVMGLGFFGVCRNRVDSLTVAATVEALDLLEYFRPAAQRSSSNDARRAAKAEAARTAEARTEEPAAKS